jgi:ribosome maturation factor RimP
MNANAVPDKVANLIAPIVAGLDLDLYDLEFNGGILKITVDTRPGSGGGVTLDQLALVNRLVGRDLDHHDPIPGHYTLEVSSPGLERTLRTPVHFQREIGKTVNVRLRAGAVDDGAPRRLQGLLLAADDTAITVRLGDGAERVLRIDAIERAKTVFVWEKGEKLTPSTGSSQKKKAAAKPAARKVRGPSDELDAPLGAVEEVEVEA